MTTELDIKVILMKEITPEAKAIELMKFMIWKKEDIINAINEFGTYKNEDLNNILRKLWRKDVSKI